MKAVSHVNLTDEAGQVWCFKNYDVVTLDGPFVAQNCWGCPAFAGLAGGYGVECNYEDDHVGKALDEVRYRNAEDARDHATDKKDIDSVANKDGKKATELRLKLSNDQEDVASDVEKEKADKAAAVPPSEEGVAITAEAPAEAALTEAASEASPKPAAKSITATIVETVLKHMAY